MPSSYKLRALRNCWVMEPFEVGGGKLEIGVGARVTLEVEDPWVDLEKEDRNDLNMLLLLVEQTCWIPLSFFYHFHFFVPIKQFELARY